jgi:hypothetical protein
MAVLYDPETPVESTAHTSVFAYSTRSFPNCCCMGLLLFFDGLCCRSHDRNSDSDNNFSNLRLRGWPFTTTGCATRAQRRQLN